MSPLLASPQEVLEQPTLVLNRSWLPVHVTPVRRALAMLYRGTAFAVRPDTYETFDFVDWVRQGPRPGGGVIRTVRCLIPAPDIVVLQRYDRSIRKSVPFNRRNLMRRDRMRCQYCGRIPSVREMTMDHVVPRALGGGTSWENCVLACMSCNNRKGGRTPRQAGMRLLAEPRTPTWDASFRGGVPSLHDFVQRIRSS